MDNLKLEEVFNALDRIRDKEKGIVEFGFDVTDSKKSIKIQENHHIKSFERSIIFIKFIVDLINESMQIKMYFPSSSKHKKYYHLEEKNKSISMHTNKIFHSMEFCINNDGELINDLSIHELCGYITDPDLTIEQKIKIFKHTKCYLRQDIYYSIKHGTLTTG